ncbi:MAG: efflux RND transporter periplasmic adaptor subunit [Planctomycetota bacterium]
MKFLPALILILALSSLSVHDGQAQDLRQMPGIANAHRSANIAAVVDQQLFEVHVSEGEMVRKGQLLATLEYSVSRAEYEAAKAIAEDQSSVYVAQMDVHEAKDRLERFEFALQTRASNQMEVRQAKIRLEKTKAILNQQKARLTQAQKTAETAKARMEAYHIRAPFDGQITRQFVTVGNLVKSGQPVFSIVDTSKLRVEMNLPLELFGAVENGDTLDLVSDVPHPTHLQAKLQFVSPTINPGSQSFRCLFEIPNNKRQYPAGIPVTISATEVNRLVQKTRPANRSIQLSSN